MESSYKVKWAIVRAKNNKVITLKDKNVLDASQNILSNTREKSIAIFGNSESKIYKSIGLLSKEMEVLFITDNQFGRMNKDKNPEWWDAAVEVATKKQINEIFTIK